MQTASFYKNLALGSLRNRWGMAVLVYFIYCLIDFAVNAVFSALSALITLPALLYSTACPMEYGSEMSGVWSQITSSMSSAVTSPIAGLILIPLSWGLRVVYLRTARGEEPDLPMLFEGYKGWRVFTTMLLSAVYCTLWSLLLIIPGIIKYYQYSQAPYILRDYADKKNNEAIEMSMDMMSGHCWRLFLLDLSFIGWALLCVLITVCTCGVGVISFLFLFPYWATARAHFYEARLAEFLNEETETTEMLTV